MKKVLMGLVAGMILATGAQALAYVCDGDTCTVPARENQAYCYGGNNSSAYCDDRSNCYDSGAYCNNSRASRARGCGCY